MPILRGPGETARAGAPTRPSRRSVGADRRNREGAPVHLTNKAADRRRIQPVKVLLLGGTGDMGRRAAVELARFPEVSCITVAGRDGTRAAAVAAKVGATARGLAVDARDRRALVAAMGDHDVVAGALGPFYLYEVPVAEAAIEAGVPYVSICDDSDGAQAVLELDEAARARGVTILTGAGWTPGLTNVLVCRGVRLLDTAREAHIAWAASVTDSEGFAVILHTLHMLTGHVPTFVNGRAQTVLAGSGRRVVDFPPPMGRVAVFHVGHPEPVTLPRFLPQLQTVTLRGGLAERTLQGVATLLVRLGLTRTPAARERLARLLRPVPRLQRMTGLSRPISAAHVEVRGTKDGRPARVELAAVGRMADLTGIPLAVATVMVGRGEVRRPGVIAPEAEGGLDPDRFLDELAARGITVHGGEVRVED